MRGSVKWQVKTIWNESGINIYSNGIANSYREVWHEFGAFAKENFKIYDFEKLSEEHIRAYLERKINNNTEQFLRHSSALEKLETALNCFADKRGSGKRYSFENEIHKVKCHVNDMLRQSGKNPIEITKTEKYNLKPVLKKQLKKSGLRDVDLETYVVVANYVSEEMAISSLNDITKASLQEYLNTAKNKLNQTRQDKVEYVLNLIIDWNNGEKSKKCMGIEVICDYCGMPAKLVKRKDVYGSGSSNIYLCSNYPTCDAYVGVHKGDNWPKGRLSNVKLRKLKVQTHNIFDILWRYGKLTRRQAYRLLQEKMGLKKHQSHIGAFNEDQCRQAISICKDYLNKTNYQGDDSCTAALTGR